MKKSFRAISLAVIVALAIPSVPAFAAPKPTLAEIEAVGHDLYFELRRIDVLTAAAIVVELTGAPGLGRAIDDRLTRAAGSTIASTSAELAKVIAEATATHD